MLPRANVAIVLSLALHLAWMLELPSSVFSTDRASEKINLKIIEKTKSNNQMLMAHQQPTQPTENKSRESWENHRAEKPMTPTELSKQKTKINANEQNLTSSDPKSVMANKIPLSDASALSEVSDASVKIKNNNELTKRIIVKGTTVRNSYEKFLQQTATALTNSPANQFENNEVGTGDRVDMDTTEYRYMGYFSSMRKAIEMVWIYPSEAARRGIQGTVTLEFHIEKNGSAKNIKILRSSGEKSLDRAIVEAISLAQPFSPLPKGLGKEQLIVTGNFNYVLTGYAISH